jgi:biotin operon repressor
VDSIRSAGRAATIVMHPLRMRILQNAQSPISASELARRLGQPRQRMNYHVRQLADAGFLIAAAQQKKRNMVEQQYVASAKAYVLTPEILGELAPGPADDADSASAAQLLGVCARAQSEIAAVMEAAQKAGVRLRTASSDYELRFRSAQERGEFMDALLEAVAELVDDYAPASPNEADGRPFRLILGCYPIPGT